MIHAVRFGNHRGQVQLMLVDSNDILAMRLHNIAGIDVILWFLEIYLSIDILESDP